MSRRYILAELVLFTFGVPLLLWLVLPSKMIPPVVLLMTIVCYAIARAVDHYYADIRQAAPEQQRRVWNWEALSNRALMRPVLLRFAFCAVLLLGLTYWLHPERLFSFVRQKPELWLMVMLLYPVFSVVPQEIIFRRYMFTRFHRVLTPGALLVLSGLGFGFAHIIFNNWMAPLLCTVGGLMFAYTYQQTRSLALVCLEHALYGNFIFTIGLGSYFYHGAIAAAH